MNKRKKLKQELIDALEKNREWTDLAKQGMGLNLSIVVSSAAVLIIKNTASYFSLFEMKAPNIVFVALLVPNILSFILVLMFYNSLREKRYNLLKNS